MLSPKEYIGDESRLKKVLSPEEYVGVKSTAKILSPDEYVKKTTAAPEMQERSFIEKHPNLYGSFGVAQTLIPYIKYIDPTERDRFAKLSTQKQTRDLLYENLNTLLYVGTGGLTRGGSALIARYLPKTAKALKFVTTPIKEWSTLAKTPAEEVAAKRLFQIKQTVFKKATGANPTPELMNQWWDDTGLAIESQIAPATPKVVPEAPKAEKSIQPSIEGTSQLTAVQKVQQAIRKSKGKIREQKLVTSEERGKRFKVAAEEWENVGGEAGFYAGKGKLTGEMPKVDYKGIGKDISQTDIDEIFNTIKTSDLQFGPQLTAARGLVKLLEGIRIPQNVEMKYLRQVLPEDFIDDLAKNRSTWLKIKEGIGQLLNIPRSLMSSFDLSAPLRQGIFLGPSHPIRFAQSFIKMFKQFGSDKAYQAVQESITKMKTYDLMQEAKLALTDIGKAMGTREEAFQSQWAEKIPLIGRGVRASSRAYMGFLNKLRADVFEDLIIKAEKLGLDPVNNMPLAQGIAKFVNAGSGRGALLKSLESSAIALNTIFFSPRLMSSRLTLLNPLYYIKQDPFVRKEALKSLFLFAGAIGTTLGIAKAAGLEVGTNWTSSDFGKIKINDTRIDIMGGFQQYIRAAGQLISGKYTSSTTGKTLTLGEGYKPLTRWDILLRQAETKTAPILSFAITLMKGQSYSGEKLDIPEEVAMRFMPMVIADTYELAKEAPDLVPLAALGVFGIGLQTYKQKDKGLNGGIKPYNGIEGINFNKE